MKQYNEKHKDELSIARKKYYLGYYIANQEKIKEKNNNNREKIKEYNFATREKRAQQYQERKLIKQQEKINETKITVEPVETKITEPKDLNPKYKAQRIYQLKNKEKIKIRQHMKQQLTAN